METKNIMEQIEQSVSTGYKETFGDTNSTVATDEEARENTAQFIKNAGIE